MELNDSPIVLVHGGRHGGWCWERLSPLLTEKGFRVYSPTLSGLGERSHLLGKFAIDLDTHISDIVGVIKHNQLKEVLLVGHSYAGMVITGVAALIPELIQHLVYLDAVIPTSGQSHLDTCDPLRAIELNRLIKEEGKGVIVPAKSSGLAYFGITDPNDEIWVGERLTDQPALTYQQKIGDVSSVDLIPKTFIRCLNSDLVPQSALEVVRTQMGFNLVEIDAGHDVMVTDPQLIAKAILNIAIAQRAR